MTVQECYEAFEGSYQEVISRLRTDERVTKFLLRVLEDGSYKLLCDSLASGNVDEAFRAAHTIKGVCLNLAITRLGTSSSTLCEYLREKRVIDDQVHAMAEQVAQDYQLTMDCISQLNK